jgi:uncharacterized protein
MRRFIGRDSELRRLDSLLESIATGGRSGRALLMRGRRRVGKSRLVEEFVERSGRPFLFFTAIGAPTGRELARFTSDLAHSSLPDADSFRDFGTPQTWEAALGMLASALPTDRPSVVVIDEVPYLTREDPAFEGALQMVFDRRLSKLPVLLILVGSDLAVMEQLSSHGRPFYQRGTEMRVTAMNPAEVGAMLDLDPADAFDAHLVSGGLPLILEEWPRGQTLWTYLEQALADPTSPLLVSGERSLAAEFPTEAQARTVLGAIGSGERSFTNLQRAAGDVHPGSLKRSLDLLEERRAVAAELPLSTKPSRETRYRIDDPYLRFWLRFLAEGMAVIERGRGDIVVERIRRDWTSWRVRAIEPVVRDALWRLAPDRLGPGTDVVGGYWTRKNDPEIDIVGADRSPVAKRITAVGSIKWLEHKPFDARDLARLVVHRSQLPGATDETPLVAVSRSGSDADGAMSFGPADLIEAWSGPDHAARG